MIFFFPSACDFSKTTCCSLKFCYELLFFFPSILFLDNLSQRKHLRALRKLLSPDPTCIRNHPAQDLGRRRGPSVELGLHLAWPVGLSLKCPRLPVALGSLCTPPGQGLCFSRFLRPKARPGAAQRSPPVRLRGLRPVCRSPVCPRRGRAGPGGRAPLPGPAPIPGAHPPGPRARAPLTSSRRRGCSCRHQLLPSLRRWAGRRQQHPPPAPQLPRRHLQPHGNRRREKEGVGERETPGQGPVPALPAASGTRARSHGPRKAGRAAAATAGTRPGAPRSAPPRAAPQVAAVPGGLRAHRPGGAGTSDTSP